MKTRREAQHTINIYSRYDINTIYIVQELRERIGVWLRHFCLNADYFHSILQLRNRSTSFLFKLAECAPSKSFCSPIKFNSNVNKLQVLSFEFKILIVLFDP